jgi:hypothetical protein
MPLTPIAGSTRLRYLQTGIESTFNTAVAATRNLPWTTVPTINPNWTFPTSDTGTLDPAIAPYATVLDLTAQSTGPAYSNDIPTLISAGVMGGLTPTGGGAAKTLTAQPASTSQDVFDTWTVEYGDDAEQWSFAGGIISDFTLDYPQDLGPIAITANWRFAKIATGPSGTKTGALSVDTNPTTLYAADTFFTVNDSSGTIEISPLANVVYGAQFSVNDNPDAKRFQSGTNTRFNIQNYSRGPRQVQLTITGAKNAQWLAEVSKFIGANPTERFFGIKTTSLIDAQSGTKHSLDIRLPGYWFTWTPQDVNTNTATQLVAQGVYDSGLGYPFRMVSVSTRSAL